MIEQEFLRCQKSIQQLLGRQQKIPVSDLLVFTPGIANIIFSHSSTEIKDLVIKTTRIK